MLPCQYKWSPETTLKATDFRICCVQRTELQNYLKRLPGDAPLRFETVFPLQHPQNFDLDALRWSATCNEKITLMALADVKSILGYR